MLNSKSEPTSSIKTKVLKWHTTKTGQTIRSTTNLGKHGGPLGGGARHHRRRLTSLGACKKAAPDGWTDWLIFRHIAHCSGRCRRSKHRGPPALGPACSTLARARPDRTQERSITSVLSSWESSSTSIQICSGVGEDTTTPKDHRTRST